jgi:hypothetical protein
MAYFVKSDGPAPRCPAGLTHQARPGSVGEMSKVPHQGHFRPSKGAISRVFPDLAADDTTVDTGGEFAALPATACGSSAKRNLNGPIPAD